MAKQKRKPPTQTQRDRIAAGVKRYWADQKPKRPPAPKKKQPQPNPDPLGFRMTDTEKNVIVFPIKGITSEIIFDFPSEAIRIKVPGVLTLTSGNQNHEEMKDLARLLNRNFNHKKDSQS